MSLQNNDVRLFLITQWSIILPELAKTVMKWFRFAWDEWTVPNTVTAALSCIIMLEVWGIDVVCNPLPFSPSFVLCGCTFVPPPPLFPNSAVITTVEVSRALAFIHSFIIHSSLSRTGKPDFIFKLIRSLLISDSTFWSLCLKKKTKKQINLKTNSPLAFPCVVRAGFLLLLLVCIYLFIFN